MGKGAWPLQVLRVIGNPTGNCSLHAITQNELILFTKLHVILNMQSKKPGLGSNFFEIVLAFVLCLPIFVKPNLECMNFNEMKDLQHPVLV